MRTDPEQPLVLLMGQCIADLRSVCLALKGQGAQVPPPGQTQNGLRNMTMSNAELVHPERNGLTKESIQEIAANPQARVVLAFDSSDQRSALLGRFGRLEKLHAALLAAGVTPERIAIVGTGEYRDAPFQNDGAGALTDEFAEDRLGQNQVAALQGFGYVAGDHAKRFIVWGNEATPAQQKKLNAWIGQAQPQHQHGSAAASNSNPLQRVHAPLGAGAYAAQQWQQQHGAAAADVIRDKYVEHGGQIPYTSTNRKTHFKHPNRSEKTVLKMLLDRATNPDRAGGKKESGATRRTIAHFLEHGTLEIKQFLVDQLKNLPYSRLINQRGGLYSPVIELKWWAATTQLFNAQMRSQQQQQHQQQQQQRQEGDAYNATPAGAAAAAAAAPASQQQQNVGGDGGGDGHDDEPVTMVTLPDNQQKAIQFAEDLQSNGKEFLADAFRQEGGVRHKQDHVLIKTFPGDPVCDVYGTQDAKVLADVIYATPGAKVLADVIYAITNNALTPELAHKIAEEVGKFSSDALSVFSEEVGKFSSDALSVFSKEKAFFDELAEREFLAGENMRSNIRAISEVAKAETAAAEQKQAGAANTGGGGGAGADADAGAAADMDHTSERVIDVARADTANTGGNAGRPPTSTTPTNGADTATLARTLHLVWDRSGTIDSNDPLVSGTLEADETPSPRRGGRTT
jgi:hypothetical protein